MSLQTKFALLLAALGSAVMVALAAAWWSLDVTYREVRGPVESSSNVLSLLVSVEKHIDDLRALAEPGDAFRSSPLRAGSATPDSPAAALNRDSFGRHAAAINVLIEQIRSENEWTGFAGKSATKNLTDKIDALRAMADLRFSGESSTWESDSSAADPDRARRPPQSPVSTGQISTQLFQIHELIKAMERRVVEDIQNLAQSGADLRLRLVAVLSLSLLLVVLTGALGFSLVHRWILHPVSDLRTAAARIAAGDFEHRIPVPANTARDEITALSAEVNHMAGMVKQMQSERVEQERLAAVGEMVRRLAHNLRNPLAGIRGLAELTRSDVSGLGPAADDVRETQRRIITAVDRFEGWLSDLLNVTKPARIHTEPTDAPTWLSGLVEAHSPLAQTRGVKLTVDQAQGPTIATFDPRHLEHALTALVSNAIEASAASSSRTGPPAVRIVSRTVDNGQSGATWELRVEDTGPGVPPNLREAIFKPYFTTKKDGNGIGLAVAQQVVRAHGGRITVEDAAYGSGESAGGSQVAGAVFVIRIPAHGRPESDTSVARIGQ